MEGGDGGEMATPQTPVAGTKKAAKKPDIETPIAKKKRKLVTGELDEIMATKSEFAEKGAMGDRFKYEDFNCEIAAQKNPPINHKQGTKVKHEEEV